MNASQERLVKHADSPDGGKVPAKKRRKNILPYVPKGNSTLDPALFINRELSWLEFNHRVLEEAYDQRHPLLERVKFLSIVSSNLDEFFMIRVAGIKEQILADFIEYSPDGLVPLQQLQSIHERVSLMLKQMSDCFWKDLHPRLDAEGIQLLKMGQITDDERTKLADYFEKEIYPVLTPLAFDPEHPFPYISNLSLNLAVVVVSQHGDEKFARVKVPDVLPRLVAIPNDQPNFNSYRFVWLEDLIASHLGLLFPGMSVKESYAFRVTRNADTEIQEDEAEDLISSIEESIRLRRFGSVVRVGVQETMPARIRNILIENLEVTKDDVYPIKQPLGLSHLMSLLKIPRPGLKDPPYNPSTHLIDEDHEDPFTVIQRGDVLLHHPYDSFSSVVHFIKHAVNDPNVLAIKQTLYRIGKESPLVPLLIEAAENGKQVAVLVELKARFDEENNIEWAKQLERAGVHVVYGVVGLKTHGKMLLIVRKERHGIQRYVHLGTGNYNPVNAKIYTDYSYFTQREDIAKDVSEVFNFLTGYSKIEKFDQLGVAPINLREKLTALIDREIEHAKAGKKSRLLFKMNSLTDVKIIEKLYEASQAGTTIDLIIRGICCLRPGLKGISENIRVISIVGRYLEHSRVYYFYNDGKYEVYMSSADLMARNLDRRVEILFPILNKDLADQAIAETLENALRDNVGARILQSDGMYTRAVRKPDETPIESQAVIAQSRSRVLSHIKAMPRSTPPF
jgi:polyphosphate kinase